MDDSRQTEGTGKIGREGLEAAVAAGKEIFGKLQAEYPDLKPYLVLALRSQQIALTTNPLDILVNCPQMVVADAAKREALRLLRERERLESAGASENTVQRTSRELADRLKELRFTSEVQIELRFERLLFDLIWALQKSPLIDRELTPQTRASIRIALGTLGNLSRTKGSQG